MIPGENVKVLTAKPSSLGIAVGPVLGVPQGSRLDV